MKRKKYIYCRGNQTKTFLLEQNASNQTIQIRLHTTKCASMLCPNTPKMTYSAWHSKYYSTKSPNIYPFIADICAGKYSHFLTSIIMLFCSFFIFYNICARKNLQKTINKNLGPLMKSNLTATCTQVVWDMIHAVVHSQHSHGMVSFNISLMTSATSASQSSQEVHSTVWSGLD